MTESDCRRHLRFRHPDARRLHRTVARRHRRRRVLRCLLLRLVARHRLHQAARLRHRRDGLPHLLGRRLHHRGRRRLLGLPELLSLPRTARVKLPLLSKVEFSWLILHS
jgi:hypothetical protein